MYSGSAGTCTGIASASSVSTNSSVARPGKRSLASAYAQGMATSSCTTRMPAQTMTPFSAKRSSGAVVSARR